MLVLGLLWFLCIQSELGRQIFAGVDFIKYFRMMFETPKRLRVYYFGVKTATFFGVEILVLKTPKLNFLSTNFGVPSTKISAYCLRNWPRSKKSWRTANQNFFDFDMSLSTDSTCTEQLPVLATGMKASLQKVPQFSWNLLCECNVPTPWCLWSTLSRSRAFQNWGWQF